MPRESATATIGILVVDRLARIHTRALRPIGFPESGFGKSLSICKAVLCAMPLPIYAHGHHSAPSATQGSVRLRSDICPGTIAICFRRGRAAD